MNIVKESKVFSGRVIKYRHQSKITKTDMTFSIYLPPLTNKLHKFPVLFFLSGLTCTDDNFTTKAGSQRIASQYGIALVAPDTSPRGLNLPNEHESYDFGSGAGFYVDASVDPYAENYRMKTYVLKELPDLLMNDNAFACLDMSRVSVMGHSMGGHGALVLGLTTASNSESLISFKSISAFAPICNPSQCPWGKKAFSGYLGTDKKLWEEYDATSLAKVLNLKKTINILIDQGTADEYYVAKQLLPENFKAVCDTRKNIELELRFQDGYDHSYYFISTFIEDHIKFHAKYLGV